MRTREKSDKIAKRNILQYRTSNASKLPDGKPLKTAAILNYSNFKATGVTEEQLE